MNKRIKKKRKIEQAIKLLIAQNGMQTEVLKSQNQRIKQLEKIVEHNAQATNEEFSTIKDSVLDNQATIADIATVVNYIKKNYKRKLRK
ncbi:hypothetical protein [Streptococcus halichoeri]|uniref:hypothetical protein n=1 Tax=Streptococcus halichoeri TaxID=254785 RepID=UPI001359AE2C|nr:hypothetical protein [Streptococcus halichoeri]